MESPAPDYVLVPLGLIIMASYHAWLLHRIIYRPTKTVAGINSINRQIWVRAMMEDTAQNGVLAVQTLRNSILASALMALATTILASLIAVRLMTNARGVEQSPEMLGDAGLNFKFLCLLACLVTAFLLSVQSARCYSYASMLITVPASCQQRRAKEYAASAVNRGSCCWSMGVRACYFAVPLSLWILGSMQMVAGCIGIVVMLYFIDAYSDWGEGEEKENAAAEETVKDIAEPQSVPPHDPEISSVELLEIIVVKD